MHYIRTRRLGLGDVIQKVTEATGIKTLVDTVSEITGVPCECEQRKEQLNNPDLLINKILNNVKSETSTNESTEGNTIG